MTNKKLNIILNIVESNETPGESCHI